MSLLMGASPSSPTRDRAASWRSTREIVGLVPSAAGQPHSTPSRTHTRATARNTAFSAWRSRCTMLTTFWLVFISPSSLSDFVW